MSFERLPTPPALGRLSMVAFSAPADDLLMVASYDRSVLLYEYTRNTRVAQLAAPAPVLAVGHTHYNATFAGLVDGTVRHVDYENMKLAGAMPGLAAAPIAAGAIHTIKPCGDIALVAATYGGTLISLDPRSSRAPHTLDTGAKVFAMDVSAHYITLARAGQSVEIYDARRLHRPLSVRSTGLRYQATAVASLPAGDGYVLGSVDGRVCVDYYDESPEAQARKYAFKCHRVRDTATGVDAVHPVSAAQFHPTFHTLLTAGGDGNVCVWNWQKRKRMKLFASPVPLAHMDLNAAGTCLAVGGGDDSYCRSATVDSATPAPGAVFVKTLSDGDCRPKN